MNEIDYRYVVHYKTYQRFEKIELKDKLEQTPLRDLILNRRTRREQSKHQIDIKTLHPLLNLAAGRTGDPNNGTGDFRAYPSAGARFPLELYIVSFDIMGLDKGLYHFSPKDGSLEILWLDDYLEKIDTLQNNAVDDFKSKAKGFLIITSILERTTFKYGDEGKIFPFIEAGYLGSNIILLLEELGINSVIIGIQWAKDGIAELLDINPIKEEVISSIAIL